MPEPQRKRRIEAEIQRVLSELIAREVKDPRVGNVTITAVSVASDMGLARIGCQRPFLGALHSFIDGTDPSMGHFSATRPGPEAA